MTKILLDIKPALDGYAGIPQETRLLFKGLQSLDSCEVQGLIQHGGETLKQGISPKKKSLSTPKKINKLSRVVISIEGGKQHSILLTIKKIKEYFSFHLLRFKAVIHLPITPTLFDASLFEDFIWRRFFSKTLSSKDKKIITTSKYQILSPSRKQLHRVGLGVKGLVATPPYVYINTQGMDIFVAQTPFPARVSKNTTMIVRYHDAVPILMPHVIENKSYHQSSHYYALQDNVCSGAWFACISEATRQDLIKVFPEVEPKTVVIHNMVSDQYYNEGSQKEQLENILLNRLGDNISPPTDNTDTQDKAGINSDFDYILVVSTIEPRKNHRLLVDAWERLKYSTMPALKLIVVGNTGWDHEDVIDAFRPWAKKGELFYLNNVPSYELRVLYKHAEATICPSLYEGFDYSGVEAMCCGGIVISSDIPVHREIYQDASVYFNHYDAENTADVIRDTLLKNKVAEKSRETLREKAKEISTLYSEKNILPKWESFINKLTEHG